MLDRQVTPTKVGEIKVGNGGTEYTQHRELQVTVYYVQSHQYHATNIFISVRKLILSILTNSVNVANKTS